jgi:hypothetical protein
MRRARMWQQQGQRAATSDLLAPINGWFTEGFDTADVQRPVLFLTAPGRENIIGPFSGMATPYYTFLQEGIP